MTAFLTYPILAAPASASLNSKKATARHQGFALLALNLVSDSFFESSCRLCGESMGRCFGILEFFESIDSAPPQSEHVETTVDVRIAVKQRCSAVPLDKHGGVTRPTIYPGPT